MARKRIDTLLVTRGLVDSREKARVMVMEGAVAADDRTIVKPNTLVREDAEVRLLQSRPFVGRGGIKLAGALDEFRLDVSSLVVVDVGASTGGFTDCLLQHGAERVYAIDVGKGLLHWKLRNDARVVVIEKTNARYFEALPERVHLVTMDVSFISLRKLLPVIVGWLEPGGDVIALIKPQFEAGPDRVGRGGVVRDPAVHREVTQQVLDFAIKHSLAPQGLICSPLRGPKGNIEFLAWLRKDAQARSTNDLLEAVFPS